MCIPGNCVTIERIPKRKAIRAYRTWALKTVRYRKHDRATYDLRARYHYDDPNSWRSGSRERHKSQIPPQDHHSHIGFHANANEPMPCSYYAVDERIGGMVLLWGVVAVHRNAETGPITGYRAQYAKVLSLSASRTSPGWSRYLNRIARRYRVKVTA